jgi:hypothetical protein
MPAAPTFSDIENRAAYAASEKGGVLIRESADGTTANHRYRIVSAINNAVLVSANSTITTIRTFCRSVDPSL